MWENEYSEQSGCRSGSLWIFRGVVSTRRTRGAVRDEEAEKLEAVHHLLFVGHQREVLRHAPACNTKGYSSTYLAMGFANDRAGTQKGRGVFGYPPEH